MIKMLRAAIALTLFAAAGLSVAQPAVTVRTITTQNLSPTGTCTAGSCAVIDMTGKGGVVIGVSGTYTASGGLSLQRTVDGTTWETISATSAFVPASGSSTATISSAATGTWQIGGACTGALYCRVTALGAVIGTASIAVNTTATPIGGNTTVSGGAGDASASNQTSGAQKTQIVDGSGNVIGSTSNALNVAITAGGGSGGTSSNFGSAVPSAGTAAGYSDGTNMQAARVADLDSGGGTQYGLVVSPRLSASGGAIELTGGSGAVAAGTLRITQASDSPLVAATGATGDSACGSDNGTCSLAALIKRTNQNLTTVNTSVNTAANYEATKDSAVPTRLVAMGARIGANADAVAQGAATVAINVSTATTTQLVALSGSTKIYVTGLTVVAGGTGNITFVYGTGSNCGTGTTSLSGAIPLIANAGLSIGSGLGAVLMVPAGQALCVTTSAAVQMSGFVTYAQF